MTAEKAMQHDIKLSVISWTDLHVSGQSFIMFLVAREVPKVHRLLDQSA